MTKITTDKAILSDVRYLKMKLRKIGRKPKDGWAIRIKSDGTMALVVTYTTHLDTDEHNWIQIL